MSSRPGASTDRLLDAAAIAESLVFCHPALGTPLDASKLSGYMRKAIKAAGIERTICPWHDLRHTALTHDAAAGNPAIICRPGPVTLRRR